MNDRRLKAQRKKLRIKEDRWRSFQQRKKREREQQDSEHSERKFAQELKAYGIRKDDPEAPIPKDYVPSIGGPLNGTPNPDPRYHELVRRLYRSTSKLYAGDDEKE